MIELYDCGKKLHMRSGYPYTNDMMDVTVSMVIKAPRGTMALFEDSSLPSRMSRKPKDGFGKLLYQIVVDYKQGRKCEAMKAFMKEHQND